MKIRRSITEPIRETATWDDRWKAEDGGLIACWERGREMRDENPVLAVQATQGHLVILPWKGGVAKKLQKEVKFGTLLYLAMWQGLRGEDLNVDTGNEITLKCASTEQIVVFTGDRAKYALE